MFPILSAAESWYWYSFTDTQINGQVTVTISGSAALDYTRNANIVGSVPVVITGSATLVYTRNASIVANISVIFVIQSNMSFSGAGGNTIVGNINVLTVCSGIMDYVRYLLPSRGCKVAFARRRTIIKKPI